MNSELTSQDYLKCTLFYLKHAIALLSQNHCYPADARYALVAVNDARKYLEPLQHILEQEFTAERKSKGHFPTTDPEQ